MYAITIRILHRLQNWSRSQMTFPGWQRRTARPSSRALTAVTEWRALVDDPNVQAVSVTAPNFLHREIGTAVVTTGKHLWIEKPVGAQRFRRTRGGNGIILGDLASHAVDLVRYLLGEVDSVIADTAIFIPQRPVPTGATAVTNSPAVRNPTRWRMKITFLRSCSWPRVLAARLRPAGYPSASRTPMDSRFTVLRA